MKRLVVISFLVLSGCVSLIAEHRSEEEQAAALATRQVEETELANAHKVLEQGRYEEARMLYRDFSGRRQQSVYLQAARMGEAQALEGLGQYKEAAELYRDIYLKTLKLQPEIASTALYRMSFAYEALGYDSKTIAALLDARRLSEHLPIEVAAAEIPARLAAVYGRQGQDQEAIHYLNEAEKGISEISARAETTLKKDWLAKTYVQMGSVSTNQLAKDNFDDFVQGQKWVQVYLIKALKLNDPVWSPRAQQKLQNTYRDLVTQLEAVPNRETQNQLAGSLFELMDQADLYRPLAGQKMNPYEQGFFGYLSEVRKKTEKIVFGSGEIMTLTEESQKLHSLKRSGRVKADALLPEEKKSSIPLPPKVVPSEDPNL